MLDESLREFSDNLASSAPTPGGGGASALTASLAVALGNMVGNLTVGKKKYADAEEAAKELNCRAEKLRQSLLNCIAKDAEAFQPLAKAYAIPKDTPQRAETIEAALFEAVKPPLEILGYCTQAAEIIEKYAEIGCRLAISDAGCAAALCAGAMKSTALNVFINTKSMKDRKAAKEFNAEADACLDASLPRLERVYKNVEQILRFEF